VKANPDPAIVKTLYEAGASFDVASMPSSTSSTSTSSTCPTRSGSLGFGTDHLRQPDQAQRDTRRVDQYKPLVTYDNFAEIGKIAKHAPHAGLALRIRVPNTGAMVELSSKFGAHSGEAVALIEAAHEQGLVVEGLSFHVGSQTTNSTTTCKP